MIYDSKDLFLKYKLMFLNYYLYSYLKTNQLHISNKNYFKYKQYLKNLKTLRNNEQNTLYASYSYKKNILETIENTYNVTKRLHHKEKFEHEQRNSSAKERTLFETYEKSNISLFHTIRANNFSNILLRLTTKEIKQVYINPQSYSRYCIDSKRLEKMFNINQQHTTDQSINLILRNSTLEKLSRIYKYKTQINRNASKAPPNILREYLRIDSLLQTMNNTVLVNLYNISKETEYFKKFYTELYWNSVFLTRISHDAQNLYKRVLKYTYNSLCRNNFLLIEYINYKNVSIQNTKEIKDRLYFFTFCSKKIPNTIKMSQSSLDICSNNILLQNLLCIWIKTLIVKKIVRVELRNIILANYTPYIIMMSKQYLRVGYHGQLSLLIHEGSLGMIEAIDRFLLGRGVRFLTYAYWWMHRYIIKVATKKQHVIKLSKQNRKRKRLDNHISKLYYNLKQTNALKKDRVEIKSVDKKTRNIEPVNNEDTKTTARKQFILFCLYTGIPPYQKHTVNHLSRIFDVSEETIFENIRKYNILV